MKYIATFLDHESTVLVDISFDAPAILEAMQNVALLLQTLNKHSEALRHAEQVTIATQHEFDNLENV